MSTRFFPEGAEGVQGIQVAVGCPMMRLLQGTLQKIQPALTPEAIKLLPAEHLEKLSTAVGDLTSISMRSRLFCDLHVVRSLVLKLQDHPEISKLQEDLHKNMAEIRRLASGYNNKLAQVDAILMDRERLISLKISESEVLSEVCGSQPLQINESTGSVHAVTTNCDTCPGVTAVNEVSKSALDIIG